MIAARGGKGGGEGEGEREGEWEITEESTTDRRHEDPTLATAALYSPLGGTRTEPGSLQTARKLVTSAKLRA